MFIEDIERNKTSSNFKSFFFQNGKKKRKNFDIKAFFS